MAKPVQIPVELTTTAAKRELDGLKRSFSGTAAGFKDVFGPVVSGVASNISSQFNQALTSLSSSLVWQAGFGQMFRHTNAAQRAVDETVQQLGIGAKFVPPEQRRMVFEQNLMLANMEQEAEAAVREQFSGETAEASLKDLNETAKRIEAVANDVRNYFTYAGMKSDYEAGRGLFFWKWW